MDLAGGRKCEAVPSGLESLSRRSDLAANQEPEAESQRDLLNTVLDTSVDAYWRHDAGGHVLEWNKAAVRMFGWTREEAIGQLLTELLVPADQRESAMQEMRNYIADAGKSPVISQVSRFTLLRKDRLEIPVELTVNAVGSGPEVTFHAFARDMTALSEARAAQLGSEATFEAVFANAPIGIAVAGLDGSFWRVNEALCRIFGFPEHELLAMTFLDLIHPEDLATDVGEATRLLNGEITSYQLDERCFGEDGHLIWIHLSVSIVRDVDGEPVNFIAHVEDASARKRDEQLLRRQVSRDTLTGVYNRSRFEEELARHEALARRHGSKDEAAVFMIDVDGLKQVNDKDGHAAGDDYLKDVARTISHLLRRSDVFARIGGDEFAALLPHTSANQAQKLARTLTEMVKADSCGSVSIGIGMITPGQLDGALERADKAMYHAKEQGGGHICGPL